MKLFDNRILSCLCLFVTFTSSTTIPFYKISASSLYDAGYQLGQKASTQIKQWVQLTEFKTTESFVQHGAGALAFHNLKRDNTAAFPEYLEEMKGLAKGANVTLDQIWIANLTPELEALQPTVQKIDHCTDIYSHDEKTDAVIHGHNEDWSTAVKKLWYLASIVPSSKDANFTACAGMSYPGTLLGYAATWSKHMYSTQNTLFPKTTKNQGLACTFVQRRAVCGKSTTSLNETVNLLHTGNWAASASINLISLNKNQGPRMANVEAYENGFSVYQISNNGNYSHMNMFKHLKLGQQMDRGDYSTEHRQERINALQAPKCVKDIANILGDHEDVKYPIYRDITLATLILDGYNNILRIWIDANPRDNEPEIILNLEDPTHCSKGFHMCNSCPPYCNPPRNWCQPDSQPCPMSSSKEAKDVDI